MVHHSKSELYKLTQKDKRIFDLMQEGSLDGIWFWDLKHPEKEWMHPKFLQLLTYASKEIANDLSGWKKIINQDDLKSANENFLNFLKNPKNQYNQIVRYKHKNGSIVWIRCRAIAIKDDKNTTTRILGIHQDITTTQASESKLKKDKEKTIQVRNKKTQQKLEMFNRVIDHSLNAFDIVDHEGKFIYVNQAYVDMSGYDSISEIIGTSPVGHCHDPNMPNIVISALKTNGFFIGEFKAKRKDGSLYDIKMYARLEYDENGNEIYPTTSIDITEQKRAKKAIAQSEEKFKGVFNSASIGIALANKKGDQMDVNDELLSMLGYTSEEYKSLNFTDITHPVDLELEMPLYYKIKNGELNRYNIEKRLCKKSGDYIWVNASIAAHRDPSGNIIMFIATVTDIALRKKAEEELNQTLKDQNLILDNDPTLITFKDNKNNILRITETVAQLTGMPKDEIEGKPSKEIYPDMADRYYADDLKIMKSRKPKKGIIEPLPVPGGKQKWLMTDRVPYFNDKNEVAGIIVFSTDITQLKENEQKIISQNHEYEVLNEELRETNQELIFAKKESESKERKLKNLIGNLKGIAYQCKNDEDWTMLFISKGVKELTGYNVDEIKDNKVISWNEIIHEDYRTHVKGKLDQTISNHKPFTLEYKIKCKDGEEKWVWEKGIIELRNKKIVRLEGFITDITPLKTYEKELLIAKEIAEASNRLKTEFLHNMSHEIRTPMNGIMGFSDMLNNPNLTFEKRDYYSKIIHNCSHQLLRVIDDILEISTLETEKVPLDESTFCLNDFLMELFSIFSLKANERNIPLYLKKELRDLQSYIITDKTKLSKILSNLLENSLKYTLQGFIEFGYSIEKPNLVLYVKDTGVGIAPENHDIIFERFSQEDKEIAKKSGGLGLGLAISKENASILGGNISLESDKDKGATFYVSIPYKPANTNNEYAPAGYADIDTISSKQNYSILVVEDEEVNYLYLEALLEENTNDNYTAIHAKNGKEAIEICLKNKSIDLILMDIKMPVMNGHNASKKIKLKFPDLPIIAQTAYSTESEKKLALDSGCDDFIAKPIQKEELYTLISRYIENK